jgi:transposase
LLLRQRQFTFGWTCPTFHTGWGPEDGSQWAAIRSIAAKDRSHQTLRSWVQQAERDTGQRPELSTDDRQRFRALERENLELRRVNQILRQASAFVAQAELSLSAIITPTRT